MNEDREFTRKLRILNATDENEYILGDQMTECFSLSQNVKEEIEEKDFKNIESLLKTDVLDNKDCLKDLVKCEDNKFDLEKMSVKVKNEVKQTKNCDEQNEIQQGTKILTKEVCESRVGLKNSSLNSNWADSNIKNNGYTHHNKNLIKNSVNKTVASIQSLPKILTVQEKQEDQVDEHLQKSNHCKNFDNSSKNKLFWINQAKRIFPNKVKDNTSSFNDKTNENNKLNSKHIYSSYKDLVKASIIYEKELTETHIPESTKRTFTKDLGTYSLGPKTTNTTHNSVDRNVLFQSTNQSAIDNNKEIANQSVTNVVLRPNRDDSSNVCTSMVKLNKEDLKLFKEKNIVFDNLTGTFKCKLCDKSYPDKRYLVQHLVAHGEKMFICLICCKGFTQKCTLDHHNKTIHLGIKIRCSDCGMEFKNRSYLKKHLNMKHNLNSSVNNLPVTCELCGKTYQNKKQLNAHKHKIHGSEAFICDDCSSAFKNKDSLRTHIMMEHLPPTLKCKLCSMIFHTGQQLYNHCLRNHKRKSFICDQCGKLFHQEWHLKVHLESHLDEKNYSCEKCGKSFKYSANLQQHLRVHSDSRLFSCDLCQDSFKFKHHLRQHMAVHGLASTPKYGRRGKRVVEKVTDSSSSETEG